MRFFISTIFLLNIIDAQIALPTFHGAQKPHTSSLSSSGIYVFTNCGAKGKSGPTQSQVNSTYTSGNTLNESVTINTQGIQEWTIPSSGTYRILASGAAGGTNGFGRGGFGGGGYSGGGCGWNGGRIDGQYGGGGGSYYNGTLISGVNDDNQSYGSVTITKQ